MATAFIGNLSNSNIKTLISSSTSTGQTSGANQVLPSNILANTTLGSGNYTYQWSQSGTVVTFTASTSNSTNCTYNSLSVVGNTTIYCTVSDTWTGVKAVTGNCIITWPIQSTLITSVTWSINGVTTSAYNGAAQSVTVVSVSPPGATYNTSTTSATNAGGVASTTITGTGSYSGSFTSPNLTIGTSTINLASSGSTSFAFNGASQTVAYTISGVYAADTGYSVSGTSSTNCNNYTVTLAETSANYTLGTSSFGWAITPTAPANFSVGVYDYFSCDFSWTAVGGCTYKVWGLASGGAWGIVVDNIPVGTTTATYAAATNFDYQFYVVAVAASGTSSASRTAYVFTGRAAYQDTIAYDSGYAAAQSPLCLTGSKSGTIGLKAWPQGTYGVIISTVFVRNASLNFASSLLWGSATRTIRWNLNGTAVNFPLSTSTSAPNPYAGPTSRAVTTSGTVTYTMVATGTGWSTNNTGGVSGTFWARAEWRWTGTQVVTIAANPSTVTYS